MVGSIPGSGLFLAFVLAGFGIDPDRVTGLDEQRHLHHQPTGQLGIFMDVGGAAGVLDADEQDYLRGAFAHMTRLLLRQQIADFQSGAAVSNCAANSGSSRGGATG